MVMQLFGFAIVAIMAAVNVEETLLVFIGTVDLPRIHPVEVLEEVEKFFLLVPWVWLVPFLLSCPVVFLGFFRPAASLRFSGSCTRAFPCTK